MYHSACDCRPAARPKSGIAPPPPQLPGPNPPLATVPRLPPSPRFITHRSLLTTHAFLIAGEKILKTRLTPSVPTPNAFLIANICPTFFPLAPLRAFLIGTRSRLEIELTHSQQTRKHFLIGTICPTFFRPAPLPTHHSSLFTRHCLTSFLFDTNKPHKIIILASLPMKTKEKQFSIRYKFSNVTVFGAPASCRTFCAFPGARVAGHGSRGKERNPRVTNHYSPITNHLSRFTASPDHPPQITVSPDAAEKGKIERAKDSLKEPS